VRPNDTAIAANENDVAATVSPACDTGTGGNTGGNISTGGDAGGNNGNSSGGGGGVFPLWQLLGLGLCILLGARRLYR